MADPRGSMWRRWDPHIHAPGTALNDQYSGDNALEQFIAAIEAADPVVSAVGVTDYLGTQCYEAVRAQKDAGRLPDVELLFPNVEMRLAIGTEEGAGVNLHLLVSPDDPDHVSEIRRFLSRLRFKYKSDEYACTLDDLIKLGRAHNPSQTDDHGAYKVGVNQFKVDFARFQEGLNASEWMRTNSLIAVASGSRDGTSGLRDPGASFAAQRKEIEAFAEIIFGSSPSQRAFWLGQKSLTPDELRAEYGGLKPCLHGSDAHQVDAVASPTADRFCWIKGDASFESLRQACLEPESRVHIGAASPADAAPSRTILRVGTEGLGWLLPEGLELNPGLVAIIGARGSGKTALADIVAHGGLSTLAFDNNKSFLSRAKHHITAGNAYLQWNSGERTATPLNERPDTDLEPYVHYLSQQFVERLCSADGLGDELIHEVQKVVFSAHPDDERLGSTSFDELRDRKIGSSRLQRQYLRDQLDRIAAEVQRQRTLKGELKAKEAQRKQLDDAVTADKTARNGIVARGEKERAELYGRLKTAIDERNRQLQALDRRTKSLQQLRKEAERHVRQVFPSIQVDVRRTYQEAGLTDTAWDAFNVGFTGNVEAALDEGERTVVAQEAALRTGTIVTPPTTTTTPEELATTALPILTQAFDELGQLIGVDQQNARRLQQLNKRIATRGLELSQLDKEIEACRSADERLREMYDDRAAVYEEFFELVVQEAEHLQDLYRPLEDMLAGAATESVRKLRLTVVRVVDLSAWAERGEELLDLRKTGTFKGRGSLADFASRTLLPAWISGTASEVSAAMAQFREEYEAAIRQQSKVDRESPDYQQWVIDVGRWLYSTDHISVTYSFEYDGVALAQLSPGTRGIVLLLLYLALDREDDRPLIIDQPEENLDPRSVFAELVELFRDARMRRQVIIVTHNANLVVNTDADQVIVASCVPGDAEHPPNITYVSGGLEDSEIRRAVCDILEGGEAAFRERAKRLRVRTP